MTKTDTFSPSAPGTAQIILFRSMNSEEIAACLHDLSSFQKKYEKDELILKAGAVTQNMGIVLSGSVTIESIDLWGNSTILSHAGKNDFFAETYAYLEEELLVDVRANEDCLIQFLDLSGLRSGSLSENCGNPSDGSHHMGSISRNSACLNTAKESGCEWQAKFTKNLLSVSMRKNLTLSSRIFHTSPRTIREKLLSYLNSVSLRAHSNEFDIPFDRQQLADYLNTDRTALSKELSKMRAEGILKCRKNHFSLL